MFRGALAVISLALLAASLSPTLLGAVETYTTEARWRSFGVLQEAGTAGGIETRIRASGDSVYQNLAVIETDEQCALYGNGQVMFVFPDPLGYEHRIHFIMAQKPDAKKILLIGGNPVGDIPELLKYPVKKLVYVELDPFVGRMIEPLARGQYNAVLSDPRVTFMPGDGVRFAGRCREQFDVILVNAPDPTTAAANRFYTLDFYRVIRRILAPDGFMYTALNVSERLQSEAASLGASVYQTMKEVFPVVLVTAGGQSQFFAGDVKAGLTFDRNRLYRQSAEAHLRTEYFRPEYFLGADEIAPEKTAFTLERFSMAGVPLNTNLRPVSYFYNLVLWSRFSGSGAESLLKSLHSLRYEKLCLNIVVAGVVCLLIGVLIGSVRFRKGGLVRRSFSEGGYSRFMTGTVIAATGFCGMALEVLLIFVFQNLYGYVYARMGLIVAMFMTGLVAGAASGKVMAGGGFRKAALSMLGLEVLLLLISMIIPYFVAWASRPELSRGLQSVIEWTIYLSVIVVGWTVGAEFPLGNRLFCDAGGSVGAAAAVTDASDHLGAAVGSFAMGVIFIPVLGIGASCATISAINGAGLLCLLSALAARGRGLSGEMETS